MPILFSSFICKLSYHLVFITLATVHGVCKVDEKLSRNHSHEEAIKTAISKDEASVKCLPVPLQRLSFVSPIRSPYLIKGYQVYEHFPFKVFRFHKSCSSFSAPLYPGEETPVASRESPSNLNGFFSLFLFLKTFP